MPALSYRRAWMLSYCVSDPALSLLSAERNELRTSYRRELAYYDERERQRADDGHGSLPGP